MVDFTILLKSLKATWVKRFCKADGSKLCSVFSSIIAQYGGQFIFECNFDTRDLNLASRAPSHYLGLINRAGGLYGRILTEVVSTDRTQ